MKLNEFGLNFGLNKFISLVSGPPDLSKDFTNDHKDISKMKDNEDAKSLILTGYNNPNFGGSLFDPFISSKRIRKGVIQERKNSLFVKIFEVRNMVVGFYNLRNVKVSNGHFLNIQLLITDPTVKQSNGFYRV